MSPAAVKTASAKTTRTTRTTRAESLPRRAGPTSWIRPARDVQHAGRRFLDKPYASTQLMLLAGGGLLAFGLMMAASTTISASLQAGSHQTMWAQVIKELEFLVLGIPIFWFAVRLSPRAYRLLTYPALLVTMTALVAVLLPGIGAEINGARRWISLGPLQLQPSEFAKIGILLWGADLLARKIELGTLTRARHLFLPLLPGFLLICALIMLEPDLGTTVCFLLILVGLLWTVGTPLRYFLVLVATVGASVGALALAAPYRLERLTSFTDPFKHAQGSGLQTVQGLYALASGGIFGVGLGGSTAKYSWLPNANTDFVFAVIGEETGLIGCLVVLGLFMLFAFTGLRISRLSADPFARLVAGGATVWICGQAVINVGYVTGLLPVTGIPLPFISAGGTSLLATSVVFGMLVSFARHEPIAIAHAQSVAAHGRRSRIERWCRIPLPRGYVAPKRARRTPTAPARSAPARSAPARSAPARSAPARSAPVRAGAADRGSARPPTGSAAYRPAPPRPAPRPTGTEGRARRMP
jgi:cell division protein FtsW